MFSHAEDVQFDEELTQPFNDGILLYSIYMYWHCACLHCFQNGSLKGKHAMVHMF